MTLSESFKQAIRGLEPGESLTLLPGQKERTARTYASELGYELLRTYNVNRNRATRTVTVTRQA